MQPKSLFASCYCKEYTAILLQSSGQEPNYPRERYNPSFRQDTRWHAAGPRHIWPGD